MNTVGRKRFPGFTTTFDYYSRTWCVLDFETGLAVPGTRCETFNEAHDRAKAKNKVINDRCLAWQSNVQFCKVS